MRKSVADYEVIESQPGWVTGPDYLVCRPPERLGEGEVVLLELLPLDPADHAGFTDRILRLASVEGELVRLIEFGPDTDGPGAYLVTEAYTGGTLADPRAALDLAARAGAVVAAARGAHSLHEVGLAHGSISAESIVFTARGPVLAPPRIHHRPGAVVDAGSWRRVAAVDPAVLAGEAPTRASDIWSLAATLHMAIAARPLYPGIESDAPVTAVQRVLFTRPEVDPALPEPLRALLRRGLEADPADRFSTAEELAASVGSRGDGP